MNTQLGIFPGVDWAEYQAIDALNGSSLLPMRRSPMLYKWMLDNPQPPTDAMTLGTATHRLILEPERVGDFEVWGEQEDQKVRRGQVWEAFRMAHAGQMIDTTALVLHLVLRDISVSLPNKFLKVLCLSVDISIPPVYSSRLPYSTLHVT